MLFASFSPNNQLAKNLNTYHFNRKILYCTTFYHNINRLWKLVLQTIDHRLTLFFFLTLFMLFCLAQTDL